MQLPRTFFALPLIAIAAFLLAVAVYGQYRRRSPIAAALVAMLAGDAFWLGAHVVLLLSPDAAVRLFWAHIQATGILVAQLSWLLLVLLYTDRIRGALRRWWARAAIFLPPLALLGALWMAPDQFFFGDWATLEVGSHLISGLGPGFWLQALWGEATSAVGTLLLVIAYRKPASPRGTRERVLIVAALLPWIASIGLLLNIRPFNLNLTPFGVALSGVLLAWGVLWRRWFGIVPMAQRMVLENFADGVIVVEREGRIVDLNPVALAFLGCGSERVLDQPADRVLAQRSQALAEAVKQAALTSKPSLIPVETAGAQRWYEVLVAPLHGWRGRRLGQMLTLHDVTERTVTDQALRQSEESYRLLAENVSDVIWTTDLARRVTYISPSVQRFIGFSPQEMRSLKLDDLFTPASAETVRAAGEAARRPDAAESWQHEVEFKRKDGSTVWAEVKGGLLRAADGQLLGVIGVARDIDQRKRVEAALQRRQDMEALATRVVTCLASATAEDLAGKITHVLRTLGEFVGVQRCYMLLLTDDGVTLERRYEWLASACDLAPMTFSSVLSFSWALAQLRQLQIVDVPDVNLLPPEAQAERDYWQASGARSALALPLVVRGRLTGILGFSAAEARPAWADEDVHLLRLVGEVVANVLTRVRFELALQASEAHLQMMNDQLEAQVEQRTAELAIANAGLRREIRRHTETEQALRQSEARNRALLRAIPDVMWVVTPTGVLIDCWAGNVEQDLFLGCRNDNGDRALADFMPPEIADQVVGVVRTALSSGHVQRQEFQITDSGRVQEYEARAVTLFDDQALVMIRNISEQKRFERQLLRSERLAALGQLAASIAHEINNPLQIIQGHLDLMLDFPLSEVEKQQYLEVTRQQMQRLNRLVADMLDLTRPQPPGMAVVTVSEPAEVTDVVQRVLTLAGKRLRQGAIQVIADLTSTMRAPIPSDQLMQVCLNLVVNAIEALQGRPNGRLQITTQQTASRLILSFRNNGAIIPPDVLPHILEPFYTTKPAGSGLGLWVCYNILRKYDGALNVRNLSDDQGVVFEISLPVAP